MIQLVPQYLVAVIGLGIGGAAGIVLPAQAMGPRWPSPIMFWGFFDQIRNAGDGESAGRLE